MATPTSLPSTFSAGAVLTAAQMNNLRGAFRILQLIHAEGTTSTTSTSATYATTNLSATITPSATSNKVLVFSNSSLLASVSSARIGLRIQRGSTTIWTNEYAFTGAADTGAMVSALYLDSPNTTSATTYTIQFARLAGIGSAIAQLLSNPSNIVLCEVSA